MAASADLGILPPDDLQPFEPAIAGFRAGELRPAHRRAARVTLARFRPAQIDHAAVRMVRRENEIAQPALAPVIHAGHATYRAGPAIGPDDFDGAALFRDEQIAGAWFERHGPGLVEGAALADLEYCFGIGQASRFLD